MSRKNQQAAQSKSEKLVKRKTIEELQEDFFKMFPKRIIDINTEAIPQMWYRVDEFLAEMGLEKEDRNEFDEDLRKGRHI